MHFTPVMMAGLRAAIGAFNPTDRMRGEAYLRSGAVLDVRTLDPQEHEPGTLGFEAEVEGSQIYLVEWTYTSPIGWMNSCTCPVGVHCKHAYAAARELIAEVGDSESAAPAPKKPPASTPPTRAQTGEAARLVALLEQRHGRTLTKAEVAFVKKLERLWDRHRTDGTIYPHELTDVSLADRGAGLYYDPNPAIRGLWETPLASALELWQFLAYFAERANRPLPPLMKPVTDTTVVRAQVEKRERQRRVDHWKQLFRGPVQPEIVGTAGTVPEVRLRLGSPKLIWEYRNVPDAPWRAAKGGMVKQWFEVASRHPAGVPADALALLQEVRLRRLQPRGYGHYTSGTEPQTLKLEDEATSEIIHWLISQPNLRHLFVNGDGDPYEIASETLTWVARPSHDNAEEVEVFLAMPDGTPVPRGTVELNGQPPFGLCDNFVYTMPPQLPGIEAGQTARVPREALEIPEAVRHLGRARVRSEGGLKLPELHRVELVPRFVCQASEYVGGRELLRVELHARSDDPTLGCEWHGTAWRRKDGSLPVEPKARKGGVAELDFARADAAVHFLADLGLQWAGWAHGWSRSMTKGFPEEFAAWAESVRAAGIEIECDSQLAGLLRAPDRARIEISVAKGEEGGTGIDWFDLQLVVRAEDATLSEEEIALLLKARGRFVLLKGKGWRRLELALEDGQLEQLGELGLDTDALAGGAQRQRFHALQLADERIAGLLPEQHAARVRERAAGMRAIAPPAAPAGLAAELRPYQHEGFHFLAHLATNGLGGVLADDMGLGKTVQALAWLLWLAAERPKKQPPRVLVVCPKSVVTNWENETRRFAPALPVTVWRPKECALPESGLAVINYTQLRLAADTLRAVVWDAVILDEGQNIKNPQSQTAKVARELRATHRLVLTGTPIENRVLDLWSLFAFAMPGLLGGQTAFKRTFNDKADPLARARLGRRVRHFMLRRTKAQVAADLPPRVEEDLVIELEPAQRRLYEAELKRARQMLLGVSSAREFDAQRFNILQSLLRLRQICCDPRLLGISTAADDSAKVGALIEQIEPILEEGHKVLIFSQFVSMLELLQPELSAREIKYLTITGQTENRQDLVDQFQASPEIRVFLLSLKAAGSGLNLTAASYVVLFDPWWNPAVEAQAIDRTHRIGQTNQVIAYRLIAKDTVEEKIRRLQQEKAELARAVVQEETLASVMNLEDLRYVLG